MRSYNCNDSTKAVVNIVSIKLVKIDEIINDITKINIHCTNKIIT